MQQLLERDDAAARDAIEIFCYRIVKYVGAYLAVLDGAMDALAFTGGIGSGSPEIRRRVCGSLGWAGWSWMRAEHPREERISVDGGA